MPDNSKQKVDHKIVGYAMNCNVVCVYCLSFRNRSGLCSILSNIRTADSFDKGRFPWSQVICTPVPHKGYLVREEILATQNLPNVQTKTKNNIRIK